MTVNTKRLRMIYAMLSAQFEFSVTTQISTSAAQEPIPVNTSVITLLAHMVVHVSMATDSKLT